MIRWGGVEPDDKQRDLWREYLEARPESMRELVEKHGLDPWTMYRLVETGQRCMFRGFDVGALSCGEVRCSATCAMPAGHAGGHDPEGLVTVRIYAENAMLGALTGTGVFGIDPESLVPWTEEDEPGDRVSDDTLVVTYTVITEPSQ